MPKPPELGGGGGGAIGIIGISGAAPGSGTGSKPAGIAATGWNKLTFSEHE